MSVETTILNSLRYDFRKLIITKDKEREREDIGQNILD